MASAAATLGLGGIVGPEDLRAVLEGIDPRSGEKLVGWRTATGFDLTLSAPKSVSLLWALGDDKVGARVMAAHDSAVAAAVSYFEDQACVVRRGKAGANRLGGAGFVSAAFRHRTSRESDPNLHTTPHPTPVPKCRAARRRRRDYRRDVRRGEQADRGDTRAGVVVGGRCDAHE